MATEFHDFDGDHTALLRTAFSTRYKSIPTPEISLADAVRARLLDLSSTGNKLVHEALTLGTREVLQKASQDS